MKLTSKIFLTLTFLLLFSATALAQTTHSVWSDKPLMVRDGQTGASFNSFVSGNAATAWTEGTVRAYVRALAVIKPGLTYNFELIKATGSDADTISGLFDVKRNGVLVCHNCVGKAYGLSSPAAGGSYFKIYIGTPAGYAEKWHYSGYITSRFDF
jgi:hypothetical protein